MRSGFKAGVGLSRESDTVSAARQAARQALDSAGLERAGWALCFFTAQHLQGAEGLRSAILQEAGCASLCGCSAMGVIAGNEEVEGGTAVAVLVGDSEGMETHSTLLPEDGEGLAAFAELGKWMSGSPVVIALPDAFQVDINRVRNRINSEIPSVPVFGAGATDNGTVGVSLQLGMEAVRSRSIALLGLFGDFELAVGITQSCRPLGEPRFITQVQENILIGLDGQPALSALIAQGKALGLEDFQQLVSEVMFGFPLDPETPNFSGETCLVRALGGLDQETRGLVIPFPLRDQTSMTFMHRHPDAAERDMQRMVKEAYAQLTGPPDFGIYFDCAARGQGLYGRPGVDSQKIRNEIGEFPLIGMYGGFELATALGNAHVYTYTGVLLLFRRAE